MKLQEAKRKARLQEWASQVKAQEESGMSVKTWCEARGLCRTTYYNWRRHVQEELLEIIENNGKLHSRELSPATGGLPQQCEDTPVFMPVSAPQGKGAALTVWIGACAIDIQNGADAGTIDQVLRTVSRL
jgi:hypothetical protein